MALISIVVPVYNAEKYLKRCLDALVCQTLADIEILCVDDGSKDASLCILNEYAEKDGRVKVFTQTNSGPAKARNTALKNATGAYVMFCDADDWYQPNMCEEMSCFLEVNQADICCCGVNIIDDDQLEQRIDNLEYYNNRYQELVDIDEKVISKTNVVLWNKIFKKELIDKYTIDFPDGHECDDDCFYLKYMAVAQKIYFTDLKLYNYFRHSDSILGEYFQKILKYIEERLFVLKNYRDFLEKYQLFPKNKFVFYQYASSIIAKSIQDKELEQSKQWFNNLFGDDKELYQFVFYKNLFSFLGINVRSKKFCKNQRYFFKYYLHFRDKYLLGFKI